MAETPSTPDLTEFYRYSKPKKPPCKIGLVLDKLGRTTKTQLVAALSTENTLITGTAILTWIEKRADTLDGVASLDINNNNVRSHREKKCTCYDR